MGETDKDTRVLMRDIIKKIQEQLDPVSNHYVEDFSISMILKPPEIELNESECVQCACNGNDESCAKHYCSDYNCKEHIIPQDCQAVACMEEAPTCPDDYFTVCPRDCGEYTCQSRATLFKPAYVVGPVPYPGNDVCKGRACSVYTPCPNGGDSCKKENSSCQGDACTTQSCVEHDCSGHSCSNVGCNPLNVSYLTKGLGHEEIQKKLQAELGKK